MTNTISPVTPLLVAKGIIRFKYTTNTLNIPFELARIVVVVLSTSAGRQAAGTWAAAAARTGPADGS